MANERLIYGLIDPDTREMRYVGSSTVGLQRPRQHFLPCAYLKSTRRVYRWMSESISQGKIPEVVILDFVPESENLIRVEDGWIKYFRAIGCRLTNSTGSAGGTGMTGNSHSQETREKISRSKKGSKLSADVRKRLSAQRKGRTPSRSVIEAAVESHRGKPMLDETRQKIREALKGVPHDEDRKARTSAAMMKWWEARRSRIS